MKILFHTDVSPGGAGTVRLEALQRDPALTVIASPLRAARNGPLRRVLRAVAWRTGSPFDSHGENRQLLALARHHRPDVVVVYNSRQIRASTLRRIRRETGAILAYIAADDIIARHNQTRWLRGTFPVWDVIFTSKSYNVPELQAAGAREVEFNENVFDPFLHRPLSPDEAGEEFEAFDFVFVGTFEADREASLSKLAQAGFSVLVQGNAAGRLSGSWQRLAQAGVTVRPAANGEDYVRALHKGKVPLGFLRKMNRDLITHRSMELTAMGRPMLAEKTVEHDQRFVDGAEYVGFRDDAEMLEKGRTLIDDPDLRRRIGEAARARCQASGYSADADMARIVDKLHSLRREFHGG